MANTQLIIVLLKRKEIIILHYKNILKNITISMIYLYTNYWNKSLRQQTFIV